jgi:molybdopterin-binding protein
VESAAEVAKTPHFRISEAAALLGVSDDTLRRWADQGRIPLHKDASGRFAVDGRKLAELAQELAELPRPRTKSPTSARNRLPGIITGVTKDGVMAQVEIQAGPFRLVSLMTREAAEEMGLQVGMAATAVVKSTQVLVQLPNS